MAKASKAVETRRADARDAEVGRRVRARRIELHQSQTDLGEKIGVTFQQVQKYEKGVNRVGAGRLQRISIALEVPVTYFYDMTESGKKNGDDASSILDKLQSRGAIRLVMAFDKIASRSGRQALIQLAEALVTEKGVD